MNRAKLNLYNRLKSRYDEREKGYWITTKSGHKVFVDEDGNITKGNPIVVAYFESGKYKRYKIRLPKVEEKELTDSITASYNKYKSHIGEFCGHTMKDNQYLFFNVSEGNYIPLHKVEKDKEFTNKAEIYKVVRDALKTAEIVSNFTDMIKADTDVKEIKKLKTSEEYFKFVKEIKQ